MTTVLVVEDNPLNLKLAEVILNRGGYSVLTARDGESGLQMVRDRCPALVVLDVQMPGMDGLAVTRTLRADPATAQVKILALTALAMKGDEERIRAAGCDAYLAKPFEFHALLDTVARLLDGTPAA